VPDPKINARLTVPAAPAETFRRGACCADRIGGRTRDREKGRERERERERELTAETSPHRDEM